MLVGGVPILGRLTGRSRQLNDVCLGDAVRDLVTAVRGRAIRVIAGARSVGPR
jgi:hypothetical protein